jgi:hypothetical protein
MDIDLYVLVCTLIIYICTRGCFFLHFMGHMLGEKGVKMGHIKIIPFFRCLKILDANLMWEGVKIEKKNKIQKKLH